MCNLKVTPIANFVFNTLKKHILSVQDNNIFEKSPVVISLRHVEFNRTIVEQRCF